MACLFPSIKCAGCMEYVCKMSSRDFQPCLWSNPDGGLLVCTEYRYILVVAVGSALDSCLDDPLEPLLTGKAQSAYAAMRAEDALDYRVLKEAIQK